MIAKQRTLPCENPATGELFDQVSISTVEDVALAREEMAQAFEIWGQKHVRERVRILKKFQALMIDSRDDISNVISQDTGKSRQNGLVELFMAVDRLHQFCKRAPKWLSRRRVSPSLYFFKRYQAEPKPIGVVAVIGPWNYPFDLIVGPICSALLAGNTVVAKPSEVTAATGAMVEKLFQSIPELAPFVRFLHGGAEVGEALVRSEPDLIFLTGSMTTGRKVGQVAAESMTPTLLQLGGKDPMIILEDADLEAAARWGAWGSFYNTGQSCMSVERVYVVEAVYDAYVSLAVEQAGRYKQGYSPEIESDFDMGPLTLERQKELIEDHMEDALAKGGRILSGGGFDNLFMEPTVLVDVDHSMKIMRDETFGPIMPIMKVRDEAEAIRLSNDSILGLSASIWSRDLERAKRVANRLEVGSVNINDTIVHYAVPMLPFGGVKQSGGARSHGEQEILQFTLLQAIAVGQPPHPLDLSTRMRKPGQYRLGAAILRLAFGVTPRQRLEPIAEEIERLRSNGKLPGKGKATLSGAALGLAGMILFGLWRGRSKSV